MVIVIVDVQVQLSAQSADEPHISDSSAELPFSVYLRPCFGLGLFNQISLNVYHSPYTEDVSF